MQRQQQQQQDTSFDSRLSRSSVPSSGGPALVQRRGGERTVVDNDPELRRLQRERQQPPVDPSWAQAQRPMDPSWAFAPSPAAAVPLMQPRVQT